MSWPREEMAAISVPGETARGTDETVVIIGFSAVCSMFLFWNACYFKTNITPDPGKNISTETIIL